MAAAHVGRADCFMILAHHGLLEPQAAYASGRAAVTRALEIDPFNAEAHASMGWISGVFDWAWVESEAWFRKSLELDPRYATAWEWLGIHLLARRRTSEAIAALREAQRIDPLSPMISSILGYGLHATGRNEEAISILSNILEMDPSFAERPVNDGFSGGEKKRNEILQMAVLKPKLALLDETDSGLDIDALQVVAKGVNTLHAEDPEMAVLVITHYQRLLDYITPDHVHVMVDGKIVRSGGPELALQLEDEGYEEFRKETAAAGRDANASE
jgi:tetratricopeptide (TPR) repeat protein